MWKYDPKIPPQFLLHTKWISYIFVLTMIGCTIPQHTINVSKQRVFVRSPGALFTNLTNEFSQAGMDYRYTLSASDTVVTIAFGNSVDGLFKIYCGDFRFIYGGDRVYSNVLVDYQLFIVPYASSEEFGNADRVIKRAVSKSGLATEYFGAYRSGKWHPTNELYITQPVLMLETSGEWISEWEKPFGN